MRSLVLLSLSHITFAELESRLRNAAVAAKRRATQALSRKAAR
jgi:hypothetical protein